MVINSGNHEFIGIRDRESQTLYISDLIEPHSPPHGYAYGQIQVGLYICAMRDSIKRAQQAKEMEEKNRNQDQGDNGDLDSATREEAISNSSNKRSGHESDNCSTDRVSNADGKGSMDHSDGGLIRPCGGGTCNNCSLALQEVS